VHLVGHSFGAKVVLSAVATEPLPRNVHSMLLLQPAVNHLCFAEAGDGEPAGGYNVVLDRVDERIFSTYSARDLPLTRFFHWALRRDGDRREPLPAPWPDPPSVFAALGGFGPHGADAATQRRPLLDAGSRYQLDPERKLVALDGTKSIAGHSAISVPQTWWALRELMWS
jgi:pimeloyl-ACP methyl ester carboxylesterase